MSPTTGSSLALRHGVQSTRPTAIAHELNKTFADIRATAVLYDEHLSKMQVQIRTLATERTGILYDKDAAITGLKREVHELQAQKTALSRNLLEESSNMKLAVACGEDLAKQLGVQGKEVVTLKDRVTELESELAKEKAKYIAERGANEKLRSISEKCAEIARLVGGHQCELQIQMLSTRERQVLSLSSALDKERLEHEKHIEDLETTHAKEIAAVNEHHDRHLAQIEVRHSEELTRVKLWQRRSTLEAEVEKTKEEAKMRALWQETRIQELERENDHVKHQLANSQRDSQWKNWMKTIMS
ncbi:hypothetical protein J4E83_003877 [Alternaria metachromatica]|uniref:uncharacterized protein n=1 Tax=Alternaria metachromatica TaxID=283354 RepID=UPI0020C40D20|nr:uncharacterized protein J4E83_003877 [Alternaria metachromatica]KAI4626725.1 hypothetical protein J4E83_003877 [Alternaria metachromatica]